MFGCYNERVSFSALTLTGRFEHGRQDGRRIISPQRHTSHWVINEPPFQIYKIDLVPQAYSSLAGKEIPVLKLIYGLAFVLHGLSHVY